MSEQHPQEAPKRKRPHEWRLWRRLVFCVEAAVLVLLLPVIAGVILIFAATDNRVRLPEGMETRIAQALDDALPDHDVSVREIDVALPEGRFTPEIVLTHLEIHDDRGLRAILPETSVVVSGAALVRGEFRPRSVRLDGAGFRFARDSDGVIDLSVTTMGANDSEGGIAETLAGIDSLFAEPAFAELEEISGSGLVLLLADDITGQLIQSQDAEMFLERKDDALTLRMTGSIAASRDARLELAVTRNPSIGRNDILFNFDNIAARDLATASSTLRWLDLIRAPMTGRLVGQVTDAGLIGDMQASLEIGAGELRPRAEADAISFDRIGAAITVEADGQRINFDELAIVSDQLSMTATGQAIAQDEGRILVGQLQFTDLVADPTGLFSAPLAFEGGALDLRLTLSPALDLQVGQAVLFDGPLRIQAWGSVTATDAGLETRVDARIPELAATDLFPYWPAFIIPGTRYWVTEHLHAGQIRDFAASFRFGPHEPQTGIRFDFDGLELTTLNDFPPITQGAGYLSVINEALALRLTEAQLEAPNGALLDLSGSTMTIDDARPRNPDAQFDLAIDGPLEGLGAVLALPPVNLLADSPLDPATLATGDVTAEVGLNFTFRRDIAGEDVGFSARGSLQNIRSDTLVPGRVLTADSLDLSVTPEVVAIAGQAEIDGAGLTGRWSQVLGSAEGSRADGRITVNAANLAALGIALPPGMLSGSGGADFALNLPRGDTPELQLSSDLSGIGLALPGLPWSLGQDTTGAFEMTVNLGPAPNIPALSLSGGGLTLAAAIDLTETGQLDVMRLTEARITGLGNITGSLRPGALRIDGGTLDLRGFRSGDGGGGGPSIDANLDRLILADGIALTGVEARLAPGLSGVFTADVNGGAGVAGQLTRSDTGLAIDVTARDAGAALRSAGLFQNGYGGTMDLSLQPTGGTGAFNGVLSIDGARLRDAPAMAELLNAISVIGLLEQLEEEGINLGDLDARFRIRPGAIILDEAAAVGPSLGISMDGVYTTTNGRYDMQGVISPFYLINGGLGAIFAQRREGLFGFSYRLEGTGAESAVTVNPLSILTPGIFREIFRRPPPSITE